MTPQTASPTAPARRPAAETGSRVELARYTVPRAGERILYGQRSSGPTEGSAYITDVPAGETGRVYLVERGVEQDGNAALQALITDYCRAAEALGAVPMAASLSPFPGAMVADYTTQCYTVVKAIV
jgi:hypothetical protein